MANNNETTTKFKVDISELKKAMQDAKRSVSVANSEFKEVASTMEDWSKSSEGLSAKLKQLGSNLKAQKTILSSLEKQYEAVVAEQGEGSAAADRLKVAINNQKATINRTEREIRKYEQSLIEVSEAEKKAAKTGRTVEEVLNDIGNEARDASDGFTTFKGAIATFAGNMLTSFVSTVKDGISSIAGLADETREYRTELAKLDTAFTTAGHSSKDATDTYKELYTVLGDEGQAVEAASMLAKLTTTQEGLAAWTDIATGVYATFGNSLPIEGLTEAANETAKTGQLTGSLADALNWAGVSEEEFQKKLDKCNSERDRAYLITEELTDLYYDASEAFKENNKSVLEANKVNSDYQDTLASLGATFEPVMTSIKQGMTSLIQEFIKLTENVDMSVVTSAISEAFTVLTETVLPAVIEGFGWIIEHKDTLIAGLAGIAAGFVAFKVASLIMSVVTALKAFGAAGALAAAKQWLLNTALLANPIVLIVTLVAGLVAALVTFIATNEKARAKLKEVWETIKTFVGNAIKKLCNFFTVTIPNAVSTMLNTINSLPEKFRSIGSNIVQGLWNGINDMTSWIKDKIKGFGDSVVNGLKDFFGIHSPSTVMRDEIGKWLAEGLALGFTGGVNNLTDDMKEALKKLIPQLQAVLTTTTNSVAGAKRGTSSRGSYKATQRALHADMSDEEFNKWYGDEPDWIGNGKATVVNNYNQTINSPKQLNRTEIYRQSKNLLGLGGSKDVYA